MGNLVCTFWEEFFLIKSYFYPFMLKRYSVSFLPVSQWVQIFYFNLTIGFYDNGFQQPVCGLPACVSFIYSLQRVFIIVLYAANSKTLSSDL